MAILESVFLVALRSGVGCIWTPVEIFSRLNDWTETFVSSNQVKCLHASKFELLEHANSKIVSFRRRNAR